MDISKIIIEKFIEYGGQWGIFISVLLWIIYKMTKALQTMREDHRIDRNEWMEKTWDQNEKTIEVQKETNKILTKIETLLER